MPDANETWWEGRRAKLDTSVIRLEWEKGVGGLKRREEEAACVVQSPELHW